MKENRSYYSCIRCHAVSYCASCDEAFSDIDIKFCPKCGKKLFIYDESVSHCLNQKKGVLQEFCNGVVVKTSIGDIKPDIKKKYFATLKVSHICSCGNYQPISITGFINLNCRNCGGRKPACICKKMST